MILQLNIKNSKEVFVSTHVTGMMYRDALYLRHKQVVEAFTPSTLDEMVDLVCRVFGNKFSIREFYEGLDKREIFSTVNQIIDAVITQDCNSVIEIEEQQVKGNTNIQMTIKELQELYDLHCIELLNKGYRVNEIDSMDINYYFYLRNKLQSLQNESKTKDGLVYIDDIL